MKNHYNSNGNFLLVIITIDDNFTCEYSSLSRACIWPLIKFDKHKVIPGTCWEKAKGEDNALRKWAIAVDEGAVECIDTVVVSLSVFYTKEPTSFFQ